MAPLSHACRWLPALVQQSLHATHATSCCRSSNTTTAAATTCTLTPPGPTPSSSSSSSTLTISSPSCFGPSPAPSLPADALCDLQLLLPPSFPLPAAPLGQQQEQEQCKGGSGRGSQLPAPMCKPSGSCVQRKLSFPGSSGSTSSSSPSSWSSWSSWSSSSSSSYSSHASYPCIPPCPFPQPVGIPTSNTPLPCPPLPTSFPASSCASTPRTPYRPLPPARLRSAYEPLPLPWAQALLSGVDQGAVLEQVQRLGGAGAAAKGSFGAFYPAHVRLPCASPDAQPMAGVLLGVKACGLACHANNGTNTAAALEGALRWEAQLHCAAQALTPLAVRLYDASSDGQGCGLLWQELGLLSGAQLCERLLAGEAELSTAQLRHVSACLLACVLSLGRGGLSHGDVKPANVVLCGAGLTPKLCDFGLAQDASQPHAGWCGTQEYQPAEALPQPSGSVLQPCLGPAADLYAVGVTALELALAGAGCSMGRYAFDDLRCGGALSGLDWRRAVADAPALSGPEGGALADLIFSLLSPCPEVRLHTALACAEHPCFAYPDSPYPGLLAREGGDQGLAELAMPQPHTLLDGEQPEQLYQVRAQHPGTLQPRAAACAPVV